tara:strand:+ start:2798 stop:3595 length:798 start_codon:yes stop_codon:yes gene_type:complete
MQIQKGKQGGPRRVLFHGTNFVGKTTFASQAFGGCLLANLEDDRDVDMDKSPPINSWDDWQEFWQYCHDQMLRNTFQYKWIAIDTIDALQCVIEKKICEDHKVESMGSDKFSYGKGGKLIEAAWMRVKTQLDILHSVTMQQDESKRIPIGIILLAHSEAVKITPPDGPSYERWEPSVCSFARDLLCDWCQEVFFGDFQTYVSTEDTGFNRTRNIAAGGNERFIRTVPNAGIRAKNRLNMPEEMTEFSFTKYAEYFIPSDVLKGKE